MNFNNKMLVVAGVLAVLLCGAYVLVADGCEASADDSYVIYDITGTLGNGECITPLDNVVVDPNGFCWWMPSSTDGDSYVIYDITGTL